MKDTVDQVDRNHEQNRKYSALQKALVSWNNVMKRVYRDTLFDVEKEMNQASVKISSD